jgi:hypothetical protein
MNLPTIPTEVTSLGAPSSAILEQGLVAPANLLVSSQFFLFSIARLVLVPAKLRMKMQIFSGTTALMDASRRKYGSTA